jgi:hypothetical protein
MVSLDAGSGNAGNGGETVPPELDTAAVLADRVAALTATADGDEGAIKVTVASSGLLTGLTLADRVRRLPGAELSAEILRAMRRAQA